MADLNRTRTFSWDDPLVGASARQSLSGLDFIRAMFKGELPAPPIMYLMGMTMLEVDEGRVVFGAEPAEFHYNPIGVVHGGLAATLFDSAMGCAINTTLPAGVGYTTVELHINYLRALTQASGLVRCEGKVLHTGKRLATAEARLTDGAGKLCGHATTTCMVFSP